jgi:hypothetical protein
VSFSGHKHVISIEIDEANLGGYTDSFLAVAWHVAQANPAPHGDRNAGELVERIGREIISRWLKGVSPELWHHQGRDYPHKHLRQFARYIPGVPDTRDPEWANGTWVRNDTEAAEGGEAK